MNIKITAEIFDEEWRLMASDGVIVDKYAGEGKKEVEHMVNAVIRKTLDCVIVFQRCNGKKVRVPVATSVTVNRILELWAVENNKKGGKLKQTVELQFKRIKK